jgi:hypothetical protein
MKDFRVKKEFCNQKNKKVSMAKKTHSYQKSGVKTSFRTRSNLMDAEKSKRWSRNSIKCNQEKTHCMLS